MVTEGADPFGPAEWIVVEPGDSPIRAAGGAAAPEPAAAEDGEDDSDLPFCAETAVLGALGLAPKHKFLYLFDFGDDHLFTLTVAGVEPRTARARYPRVVERKGRRTAAVPRVGRRGYRRGGRVAITPRPTCCSPSAASSAK